MCQEGGQPAVLPGGSRLPSLMVLPRPGLHQPRPCFALGGKACRQGGPCWLPARSPPAFTYHQKGSRARLSPLTPKQGSVLVLSSAPCQGTAPKATRTPQRGKGQPEAYKETSCWIGPCVHGPGLGEQHSKAEPGASPWTPAWGPLSKPGASSPPCGAPWWAPWGSADLSRRFGRGQSTICCCLAGNAAVLADAKHPDVNKADCALRAPETRSRQRSSPQRADSRFSLSRRRAAVRSTECMLQAPLLLQEEAR